MSCPEDDTLIALVERTLAPDAMATLAEHVDGCERCRATVGHLAAVDGERTPRAVGRYQLEDRIGAGGMGVVWKAWDPMLERRVAIKLLRPDVGEHGTARLLREARALAQLQHPNVVAVHDVGEVAGEVFLATELVDGQALDRWQPGRAPDELVAVYVQAARGLAAAHAMGLVHRDVKPSNLLVAHDGRVRVGDFGLVGRPRGHGTEDREGQLTLDGDVVGTPAYMAPEQRSGAPLDARVDQFALCVALAEALTGERPHADATASDLRALRPVEAPWVAIARGLARDPAERFATMTELADALAAHGAPRRTRIGALPWLVAAAGGAVAVVAVTVAMTGSPGGVVASPAIATGDASLAPPIAVAMYADAMNLTDAPPTDATLIDARPPLDAAVHRHPKPREPIVLGAEFVVIPSGLAECDAHQEAVIRLASCATIPDITRATLRDAIVQIHGQTISPAVLGDANARGLRAHGCELMRESVEKLAKGLGCR